MPKFIFIADSQITKDFARKRGINDPVILKRLPPLPVCFDPSETAIEIYCDLLEDILPSYCMILERARLAEEEGVQIDSILSVLSQW